MIELALVAAMAIPLFVALGFAVWPAPSERNAARLALATTAVSAAASVLAIGAWLFAGAHPVHTPPHVLFSHGDDAFTFELVLDPTAAVFLSLVQFITGMIVRFSRFYLHREPGFRRFFSTVSMFQSAMCVLALAGNLDLMFAGWEMVGLSSFLLIAFYRERRSAVRNALKTYSVYRVADLGMLLAACLEGSRERAPLGLLLLLAAMGKSAQLPFSFWVTRAMEGPTPSSALFYGALSVHAGAFLLLRTFQLWGDLVVVKVCVGLVGIATAVVCSMFSRAQPTIKGQIGYASVTQVGIIFVEIALGLTNLALAHIVCNALLRCYQLLVSPSVVAHRLRRQATAGAARVVPARSVYQRLVPDSLRPTLYVFALSEGYGKDSLRAALWTPLRRIGEALLPRRHALLALGLAAIPASLHFGRGSVGSAFLPVAVAAAFSLAGLVQWRRPAQAIAWISGSSLLGTLAILTTAHGRGAFAAGFHSLGVALSCVFGVAGLGAAISARGMPARFAGRWASRPLAASIALVGALGLGGFPLLPTFLGEDLVVHAALGVHGGFGVALASLFALNGYLAMRTFAFTFFGNPGQESTAATAEPMPMRTATKPRVGVVPS